MKIYVNQIPEEGLTEQATYDPAALDMDRIDIHPRQPFRVEARILKADQELIGHADIPAPLIMTCARCLEDFASTVTPQNVFTYRVGPKEVVDITDDVRQEVILAYPPVPICRPTCKGLCATCGQNLNQAGCSHPQHLETNNP